ncbi:3-methyl-2-oxobutanoate hydroxymethyltransferase [Bacillus taeanensis]|uniref:3-methyl-2-oxobutanoate hydroxymethyltransferase n=1 Tax=Bacillus taeanensis TaxID=273032 RepID=A0A366Y1F8_9BACI|nr:3-methyl-2-oxobutanoate hydroxymethyltransferase [Bacillus taeanensis]RBW70253.1 3-methyl-2-oxobutanoate hydroxymethyltransferase [Bacillus taeanensis]
MKTSLDFQKMKLNKEPIAMVTAYDYPSGKFAEQADVDVILVGDSVGMVALGYESTVFVTLEDMILHTKAVKRGAPNTFIVTDMPFMTYHSSVSETMENAKRLVQSGGAHAVKLEGAGEVIEMIDKLTSAGVPVVGHLGLTPQSVGVLGGYKVQGKEADEAKKLIEDAKEIEKAGAFAIVLECVPKQVAAIVSSELSIPTIGIGAGAETDGQVLVYHDVIGYGEHRVPKFVKQYYNVSADVQNAVKTYVREVKKKQFPQDEHSFTMKQEEIEALYGGVRT